MALNKYLLTVTPSSAAVYKLTFLRKIGEANAKTAIYKLSNEGAQRRSDAATTCYSFAF